jgi:ADP-ribose pyrophosphatase YjhB (NUDIX family)
MVTTNQSTSYPGFILKNRNVHAVDPSFTDDDIIRRTSMIKNPEGDRFTSEQLSWDNQLPNYNPIELTDGHTANQNNDLFKNTDHVQKVLSGDIKGFIGYADPPLINGRLSDEGRQELETGIGTRYCFARSDSINTVTTVAINRKSHTGQLKFDPVTNLPLNPLGRTGLTGRGFLGRFGPNHAADGLVVRFRDGTLQVAMAYRNRDTRWAIPGGMVDFDENPINSMFRELCEETGLNFYDQIRNYFFSENQMEGDTIFQDSTQFISWVGFKGQVDDDRNTDNAWMETMACVIILGDELSKTFTRFDVQDTQEIGVACWVTVTRDFLTGKVPYTVSANGKTYSCTLWETHMKLLNTLVQQIVDRGFATCSPDGLYLKTH